VASDLEATAELVGGILRPIREHRESSRLEQRTQPELRARSTSILEHATGFRLAVQVQDEAAAVEHYSQLRQLLD